MEWVSISPLALRQFRQQVSAPLTEPGARVFLWRALQPHAPGRSGVTVLRLATPWGPVRLLCRRYAFTGPAGQRHWRLQVQAVLARSRAA